MFLRIFAEPTSEHVDETSSSKSHGLKSPLLLGPDIDRSATAFQFHRDLIELNEIKNEMDEARREIGRHRETLGAKQPEGMTEQTRTAAIMVAHQAATEAWVSLMDIAVKLEVPELDNASIALGAALKELLRAMLEFLISDQSVIDAEDRTLFPRLLLEMKE